MRELLYVKKQCSSRITSRITHEGTGTEARKAGTDMYIFYLSKNERREDEIVSKSDVITIKNNPPNKNHKKLYILIISLASITPSGVLVVDGVAISYAVLVAFEVPLLHLHCSRPQR